MTVRDHYLIAVESAVELLADPAVSEYWHRPSALAEMSVGALAAQLGARINRVLTVEPVADEPLPLVEHFVRSPWVGYGPETEINIANRTKFEQAAEMGPAELVEQSRVELTQVRTLIASAPDDQVVRLPWTDWNLTLDDLLFTRLLEIAIHKDDLAVSAGPPTPELPDEALFAVTDLLSRLAVRRHGHNALLRTLARSERAPENVSALRVLSQPKE